MGIVGGRHPRRQGGQAFRDPGTDPPGRPSQFGAFGKDAAKGMTLRHDHGSQFIADDFQNEITFLGHVDIYLSQTTIAAT